MSYPPLFVFSAILSAANLVENKEDEIKGIEAKSVEFKQHFERRRMDNERLTKKT